MRAALVVVDMQNDFLARGGYYDRRVRVRETARRLARPSPCRDFVPRDVAARDVIVRVCEAITVARTMRWAIAFVRAVYSARFADRPRFLRGDERRRHHPCKPGTWGARLVDPVARLARRRANDGPPEGVFDKHTFDGFHRTRLEAFLRDAGIEAVFVVGVETHACVLATSMSAAVSGFRTTIVEDCVWTARGRLHGPTLTIFSDAFGTTDTLANLRGRVRGDGEASLVRQSWAVCGRPVPGRGRARARDRR